MACRARREPGARGKKNFGEAGCPASLAGLVANLVVANFDHCSGQVPRPGVTGDRVVDMVGRRIGLVDADGQRRVVLKRAEEVVG